MKNLKILILGSLTTVNILLLGDSYLCQQYNEASNNTEITSECIETTSSEETFINTEETTNEILSETTSEDVIDDLEGYCYSDEDLYLLARVIDAEASDICTNEHKMCTGQVILNRMNSNKYPNTLREVVYDKGQYASVENNKLKKEISKESLESGNYEQKLSASGSIATKIKAVRPIVDFRVEVYRGMTMEELAAQLDKSLKSTLEGTGYLFATKCIDNLKKISHIVNTMR